MTEHDLKCWPEYFQAVRSGRKPFEIRKEDDRRFAEGDTLRLREWEPLSSSYTGASVSVRVSYVLRGGPWLPEGYVCMGVKLPGQARIVGQTTRPAFPFEED
jgi:hypothetical protein